MEVVEEFAVSEVTAKDEEIELLELAANDADVVVVLLLAVIAFKAYELESAYDALVLLLAANVFKA